MKRTIKRSLFLMAFLTHWQIALAEESQPTPAQEEKTSGGEKVDVNNIKDRYWTKGKSAEVGVVQNRKFSKSNKFQFGVFGGIVAVDPFLSVQTLGSSFGYHFSETYSLHLTGMYNFVADSLAYERYKAEKDGKINTNKPNGYLGLENNWSLLYGKLSLLGKQIIYFDLHVGAGLGLDFTESGKYIAPSIMIGQRFYITQVMSLRLDYRLMYRRESFYEQQITSQLGTLKGPRNAFSHVITLGVDFLIGKGLGE